MKAFARAQDVFIRPGVCVCARTVLELCGAVESISSGAGATGGYTLAGVVAACVFGAKKRRRGTNGRGTACGSCERGLASCSACGVVKCAMHFEFERAGQS